MPCSRNQLRTQSNRTSSPADNPPEEQGSQDSRAADSTPARALTNEEELVLEQLRILSP
ncbi:hypothetical protein PtA15_1A83 [Puccinia triticina]|uniref:Uncharacterized protein n=1 Tax=Puccinia triticina TaxID=208348 RepID=A0ABY7C7I2_9BASI|nr:uncharacterized protein PtA15_1A83 [Puccinia triticina]WAQ80745.1 hypothetical protein PtA15_1A83 [Puccinia triticina]WAR51635.1 hypothetical protein PtB15_1B71 [Puccinia triticina]